MRNSTCPWVYPGGINEPIDGDQHFPILTEISIAPLQSHSVVGGREVFAVGEDFVFRTTDSPNFRHTLARCCRNSAPQRFPVPDRVGEYCSREDFEKLPKYMAQWVHWPSGSNVYLRAGMTSCDRPISKAFSLCM